MSNVRGVPPQDLIRLSAVTFGEIQAGHEMSATTDRQRRSDFDKFVVDEYQHLVMDVTAATRIYYGRVMGRVWNKYKPPSGRVGTDAHLVTLGLNVNDVWLVAAAYEHGLIILTQDKMPCIRDVVPEVRFDCWI